MAKKNTKKVGLGHVPMLLLLGVLLGLTALRLFVACSGSLGESEALLLACAVHPAGGYVEGACGTPLLCTLLELLKPFVGASQITLRWISPLVALLMSWCVWKIARRLSPRTPAVALWSVIALNLLPWVNMASFVMDGALVTSSLILLAVLLGWNALDASGTKSGKSKGASGTLLPWFLFGVALGLGTLFFYPVGLLLPMALAAHFFLHSGKPFPWYGLLIALGLLAAGWIAPLIWNAHHDWIQWSSVAYGFDSYDIAGWRLSLSLCVVISALIIPVLVLCATSSLWLGRGLMILLLIMGCLSAMVLLMPAQIPPTLPSPCGVDGVSELASEIIQLRKERPDSKGHLSFLIAQTSGLAALLGEKIQIAYPERSGAPSVFVAESPSLNSSYSLWPTYADAVTPVVTDILYTTEPFVSPFIGRNALYITTEAPNELPQIITGAFSAVGLLKELQIMKNGHKEIIRIYQCENYRSLSL